MDHEGCRRTCLACYRTSLERVTDRFAKLSARDTAITLRSLGRRISEAASPGLSPDLSQRSGAPGPGGRSLDDLLDTAARTQAFLLNELGRSLDHEDPVLPAATLDSTERHFAEQRPASSSDALSSLKMDTQACAARVETASAGSLARPVTIVGGRLTSPLEIAQEAARSGIGDLGQIQAQVDWLRRTNSSTG